MFVTVTVAKMRLVNSSECCDVSGPGGGAGSAPNCESLADDGRSKWGSGLEEAASVCTTNREGNKGVSRIKELSAVDVTVPGKEGAEGQRKDVPRSAPVGTLVYAKEVREGKEEIRMHRRVRGRGICCHLPAAGSVQYMRARAKNAWKEFNIGLP